VGWFGFNVMSAQSIDKVSGLVALNSLMAMAGGTLAALGGYPSLFFAMACACVIGFLRVLLPAWRGVRTRDWSRL